MAAKEYRMYRWGKKKPIRGLVEETGDKLGKGTAYWSVRAKVKVGKSTLRLAEKNAESLTPRTVFILNKLKKLGLSTIPTARLAVEGGLRDRYERSRSVRLIMNDLSCGGKFKVVDYKDELHDIRHEIKGLANYEQIEGQIRRESIIAAKNGINFIAREWLIVIDPKTNMGKPYIVDVKVSELSKELEKELKVWTHSIGI